jgi:hypothetical protein
MSDIIFYPYKTHHTYAWHVIPRNMTLRYGDNRTVRVGDYVSVDGKLEMCKNGLHASNSITDAIGYYFISSRSSTRFSLDGILCKVKIFSPWIEMVYPDFFGRGDNQKYCATGRQILFISPLETIYRHWLGLRISDPKYTNDKRFEAIAEKEKINHYYDNHRNRQRHHW